jgi:hypothetical protein
VEGKIGEANAAGRFHSRRRLSRWQQGGTVTRTAAAVSESGISVMAINFRLSPEVRFRRITSIAAARSGFARSKQQMEH